MLFIVMLVANQMIIPAGIVIIIALSRTKIVLSRIDLIMVSIIFGFLYGGNSKVNDDGFPFRIVFDSILDINSVIRTEKIITPKRIRADVIDAVNL